MPAEGKSFIAANLAVSLARNSIHNILLIDARFAPSYAARSAWRSENKPGLSDYLAGNADVVDVMQRARAPKSGDDGVATKIANSCTFIPSWREL